MRTFAARGLALAAVIGLVAACSSIGVVGGALGRRGGHRRGDQDRRRLRPHRRRVGPRPAGRERRQAGGRRDQQGGRRARLADRLHRPRQPVQDGRHRPDGQAVRRAGQGPADGRLHRHRLRARVRPDVPVGEDPVHHRRRDVAQDPVPGRRHDVPGLLRRQRAGGGRRRVRVRQVRQQRRTSCGTRASSTRRCWASTSSRASPSSAGRSPSRTRTTTRRPTSRRRSPRSRRSARRPTSTTSPRCRTTSGPLVKQFRDAGLTGPDRRRRRLRHARPRQGRGPDDEQRVLHDARPDGRRPNGTDGIKKFIAAYKAEYGNDPENAFAALGYDTVYLLADAIKRAGGTDSAADQDGPRGDQGLPGHHRQDHVLAPTATSRRRA